VGNRGRGRRELWTQGIGLLVAAVTLGVWICSNGTAAAQPYAYVTEVTPFDAAIGVIDTATATLVTSIPVEDGFYPSGVAALPDGSRVFIAGINGGVATISTATNALVAPTADGGDEFRSAGVRPDGCQLYLPGSSEVTVLDPATFQLLGSIDLSPFGIQSLNHIAFSPDGRHAYATGRDSNPNGLVTEIDTATLTVVGDPILPCYTPPGEADEVCSQYADHVSVTPNGAEIWVTDHQLREIWIINAATRAVTAFRPSDFVNDFLAFSPDGAHAYLGEAGGYAPSLQVVDTATRSVVNEVSPDSIQEQIKDIAITPDGARGFLVGPGSGSVYVYDTASNTISPNAIAVGALSTYIAIAAPIHQVSCPEPAAAWTGLAALAALAATSARRRGQKI